MATAPDLASRYVDVDAIPWTPTRFPGVAMRILMQDEARGMTTALFRFEPGAHLPDHEHVEIEQSWVLSGSLVDHEGAVTAGNYVWRPAGNRHVAHAPEGAVVLTFLLKPNLFFDEGAPPR